MKIKLSPESLDAQSIITIDEWVDVDSERCKEINDDITTTRVLLRLGFEHNAMFSDSTGRIWGPGPTPNTYCPFHFDYGNKRIGVMQKFRATN